MGEPQINATKDDMLACVALSLAMARKAGASDHVARLTMSPAAHALLWDGALPANPWLADGKVLGLSVTIDAEQWEPVTAFFGDRWFAPTLDAARDFAAHFGDGPERRLRRDAITDEQFRPS